MKETIIKNKFLLTILLFLLLTIFVFTNFSYCSNSLNDDFYYPQEIKTPFNFTLDKVQLFSQTLYKQDETYYILAWYLGNSNTSEIKLYMNEGYCYPNASYVDGNHFTLFKYSNNEWSAVCWWYFSDSSFRPFPQCSQGHLSKFISSNTSEIISTSCDIYENDSFEKIFFQNPLRVTIPTVVQVEEIPKAMNKALQVIIPIGLVVLSIGLLIYVVKSVILRKT